MTLKFIIITLSVIKMFAINLIPIMRAFKHCFLQELTGVLMVLKVGISVGTEMAVISKANLMKKI